MAGVSGLALASSAYLTPPPRRPYHGSLTSGDPNRACTDALLWATGAGYALQLLTGHAFTNLGAKVNAQIAAGQLWRLVTPMFLHGSVVHLAVNCMSLHNLGPVVERQFGRDQFWAIYVGSAVGGNFLSYKFCPNNAVGASSAIFGLVGAMGVYLHRHRDLFGEYGERQLHNLLGSVGLNAAFGMMSKRIDNYAHLGGLLAGAAVAFLVGPNLILVDPDDRVKGMARIGRRAVVNRPLLQAYSGSLRRSSGATRVSSPRARAVRRPCRRAHSHYRTSRESVSARARSAVVEWSVAVVATRRGDKVLPRWTGKRI